VAGIKVVPNNTALFVSKKKGQIGFGEDLGAPVVRPASLTIDGYRVIDDATKWGDKVRLVQASGGRRHRVERRESRSISRWKDGLVRGCCVVVVRSRAFATWTWSGAGRAGPTPSPS
jgi:hypothetical protein